MNVTIVHMRQLLCAQRCAIHHVVAAPPAAAAVVAEARPVDMLARI